MAAAFQSSALRKELSRLVGAEHVIAPVAASSPYNSDTTGGWRGLHGQADAVVCPGSAEEVRSVVELCYRHDLPIVPRGGGSGVSGGATPIGGGVVCSLERLTRVIELEPSLWRMHVQAGISTAHVHRLARENGLFFGPDPGAAEQSQIGGNVATNAGGPHAFKYGPTGSWVGGLQVVLAPGELVQVGGAFRRDVAGYDLKSLLVGSEGTLGLVTAVQLRLLPAPEEALGLVAFYADRAQGATAILEALGSGVFPSALEFLDGETLSILSSTYPGEVPPDAGFALMLEVDGTREAARIARDELAGVLSGGALELQQTPDLKELWHWRNGVSGAVSAVVGGKVSEDVIVPVERLEQTLSRFEEIASRHGLRSCVWGHGGDGNLHATVLIDPGSSSDLHAAHAVCEELFGLTIEMGGSISGEHGIGWVKRGQLAKQWPERALLLHEQIKLALDPKGLLNPGKKLAREP